MTSLKSAWEETTILRLVTRSSLKMSPYMAASRHSDETGKDGSISGKFRVNKCVGG